MSIIISQLKCAALKIELKLSKHIVVDIRRERKYFMDPLGSNLHV